MRQVVLLFCALLIADFVHSQEYSPFNLESGEWYCRYSSKGGMFGGGHETYYATDSIKFYCMGDTVINSLKYKKLFYSGYTWSQAVKHAYIAGYMGAIRNDTLNRKVFFLEKSYNNNYQGTGDLLYDFNLKIGDELCGECTADQKDTITNIDSVLVCNQFFRRFTTLSGYSLIEGIGSDYGFLPLNFMTSFGRMLCYMERDNDMCENCGFATHANSYTTKALHVYPNPSSGPIKLVESQDVIFIEIFDSNGTLISIIKDNFETIEIKKKGFYVLNIHTNFHVKTQKVIVQ